MNILIVKLSAIGDVVHTIPSLVELRRLYPNAHLTWVVEEEAADLVQNHPMLDAVLVSRRKRWWEEIRKGMLGQPLREMRLFVKSLRQRSYDLVIDFHGLFKSAVVVWLSGGKRKLGYDSWQELSGWFLNEKIPEDMTKHAVDRYLDLVRYLGASPSDVKFVLPSDGKAERRAEALLRRFGLDDKTFVAINPVALWKTKLWSDEKFAILADRIYRELQLKVVFTGKEKRSLDPILSRVTTPAVNLGGETTLLELASVYRKAKLVVTTDSGPMHIAVAVNTPVVALFGATDPRRTGPYGSGHVVIRAPLPCSPCFLKKCPRPRCMEDISPQQVFSAVKNQVEA